MHPLIWYGITPDLYKTYSFGLHYGIVTAEDYMCYD